LTICPPNGYAGVDAPGAALGRVECIAVDGLDLWFNSNDHRPPHFHARRSGEYELRVYFLLSTAEHLEYEVKWSKPGKRPPADIRKTLRDLAVKNRLALLEEWETKVCQE
jgi:hypothetical protein